MGIESFLLSAVLIMILASGLKVTAESERFAVIAAGRLVRLAGPGLSFRLPGSAEQWTRIKLGDSGRYLGDGLAEINGATVPILDEDLRPGDSVKVTSFRDSSIRVSGEP